jgi:ATP-binding cassette subfamily F protein uup
MALYGDGTLRDLPGGVDEYLARVQAAPEAAPAKKERSGDSRAARKELTRLERLMEKLERDETRLHAALAASATDYEAVGRLDAELRDVAAKKAAAEEEWLRLSDDA